MDPERPSSMSPNLFGVMTFERSLGEGGTGAVWLVSLSTQDEKLAVKTLRATLEASDKAVQGFHDEARALASLNHPGIVRILDAGVADMADAIASRGRIQRGAPYLIMDFAEAGSLADLTQPLGYDGVMRVTSDLLTALAHAHTRGLLHRDIKPANVLLRVQPSELVTCRLRSAVCLADFGIAVGLEQLRGDETRVVGTYSFMSPEHLNGRSRDYGPATDLYSVACMVWYLLYGQVPHQNNSKDVYELVQRRLGNQPLLLPPGRLPHPVFHPWLERLLAYDPWTRYGSAADALAALEMRANDISLTDVTLTLPHVPLLSDETELDNLALDVTQLAKPLLTHALASSSVPTVDEVASLPTKQQGGQFSIPNRSPTVDAVPHAIVEVDSFAPFTAPAAQSLESRVDGLMRGLLRADDEVQPVTGVFGASLIRLRRPPVVGRTSLRRQLIKRFVTTCRAREPLLQVLTGPAGVGKSSVVQWLSRELNERGLAATWWAQHATYAQSGTGMSAMVRRHFGCVGRDQHEIRHRAHQLTRSEGGSTAEARLASALMVADQKIDFGDVSLQFTSSRDRYVGLGRLLRNMATRRPQVIVVDDAQWGADMCQAVVHLMSLKLPLLIIMTWRGSVASMNRELRQQGASHDALRKLIQDEAECHELKPLSPAEQRKVVASTLALDEAVLDFVVNVSQGTPLLAVQMVLELLDSGELAGQEAGFSAAHPQLTAPMHLSSLWPRRLSTLAMHIDLTPAHVTEMLELAAILGRTLVLRELREALALAKKTWPKKLLGAMETHGLGHYDARRGTFEFAHGLLQEWLIQRSRAGGREADFHGLIARVLGAREGLDDGDLERLGLHRARSGDHKGGLFAWRQLADRLMERSELQAARRICTLVQALVDDPGAALSAEDRAWGYELFAQMNCRFGYTDDAEVALASARGFARDETSPRLDAHLHATEGFIGQMAGRPVDAVAAYDRALAYEDASVAQRSHGRWLYGKACTLKLLGRLEAAQACYEASCQVFRVVQDSVGDLRSALALAELLTRQGRYEAAEELLQRCLLSPETSRFQLLRTMLLLNQGALLRARDRSDEAIPHYSEALDLLVELESTDVIAPASNLVGIYLTHGMVDLADKMMAFFESAVSNSGRDGMMDYVRAQRSGVDALLSRWENVAVLAKRSVEAIDAQPMVDTDIAMAWLVAFEEAYATEHYGIASSLALLVAHQLERLPDLPAVDDMRRRHRACLVD